MSHKRKFSEYSTSERLIQNQKNKEKLVLLQKEKEIKQFSKMHKGDYMHQKVITKDLDLIRNMAEDPHDTNVSQELSSNYEELVANKNIDFQMLSGSLNNWYVTNK